jgi:hypothetical protein
MTGDEILARRKRAASLRAEGKLPAEIAAELGVTRQRVLQILAQPADKVARCRRCGGPATPPRYLCDSCPAVHDLRRVERVVCGKCNTRHTRHQTGLCFACRGLAPGRRKCSACEATGTTHPSGVCGDCRYRRARKGGG